MSSGTSKRLRRTFALPATLAAALVATLALAAEPAPVYRVQAEVDVKGVVANVVQHAGWMGWDGVYATLRTGQGEMHEVHLAPREFLQMIEFTPAHGDALEIRGAFAETPSGRVLLVRELRRENVRIRLRDETGRPIW